MAEDNRDDLTLEDILDEQRQQKEQVDNKQKRQPQQGSSQQRPAGQRSPRKRRAPNSNPANQSVEREKPIDEQGVDSSAQNAREEQGSEQQRPREEQARGERSQEQQSQAQPQRRPRPQGNIQPQGNRRPPQERPVSQNPVEDAADISQYASNTGAIPQELVDADIPSTANYEEADNKSRKKKEKKKRGLFGRKKDKIPEFDESESEFYGVQLKPVSEYRKGFNPNTGEIDLGEDGYADLFDDSKKAIDDEVEENFKRLQRERRSRVAEAVQNAGMEESDIEDELGIIAPMPVSSYSSDPYTKQHGTAPQNIKEEDMPEFQKAMLDSMEEQGNTMELKLNVMNDTVEIQKINADDIADEVADGAVDGHTGVIEKPVARNPRKGANGPQRRPIKNAPIKAQQENEFEEIEELADSQEMMAGKPEKTAKDNIESAKQTRADDIDESTADSSDDAEKTAVFNKEELNKVSDEDIIKGREAEELPQVSSIYEYRSRGIPTHVINADVLQSALLSEAMGLAPKRPAREEAAPARRQPAAYTEDFDDIESGHSYSVSNESIDDYTSPEDAKSISNELRGDMRDLTLRMLIAGVCTIGLTIINIIFGSVFKSGDDIGSAPVIYIVLTLIFLGATATVCFKTIINGLKALIRFKANSDSAVAVASIGVLVQTLTAIFFTQDLMLGKIHLYAVVLTAILFINAAGKLTMIRRIHSNFRFVSSKEDKYAVKLYDDYNTALKMTKNSATENPALAYQTKTGFLKRFLELSYAPDPAETSSQMVAPIGLIASLVLCIVTLLLTGSVAAAISALAASLCVCVAAANMIAINLPISRLCKSARRAGGMVVGYEGVREVGGVNSVMMDAEDLFPKGTVVLKGIKTYGDKYAAEEAIMSASALMNQAQGPLLGVFEQVISENEDSLPEVEGYEYEDENGIIGRIDGKRVFIGTRSLLINHHLEPPSKNDETEYSVGNNQIIYIAVDLEVVAMMVISYTADRKRKNELQRLEDNGISVVIRTNDPNITQQFVSRIFNLEAASVSVLPAELGDIYVGLVSDEVPRSDATVATKGRIESLMALISACASEKKNVNFVVTLQNVAIILGFVLVAFLACFGAMGALSSLVLFLFMAFWVALIVVLPRVRK